MQDATDLKITTASRNAADLPAHLKASLDRYVVGGIAPGGFLRACIENDLCSAVARADDENFLRLGQIISYLYHECPTGCWGHKGVIEQWRGRVRCEQAGGEKLP